MGTPRPFSKVSLASPKYSFKSQGESLGLPDDEYRILKGRQDQERLEAHFSHSGSPGFPCSPTIYQQAGVIKNRRLSISKVRGSTRKALGENFDFTYQSFDEHQRAVTRRSEEVEVEAKAEEPIPQRYLDEYHKRSREDCRKYDGDQDLEDCTSGIAWVMCDPADRDVSAMSSTQCPSVITLAPTPKIQPIERKDRLSSAMHSRTNSAIEEGYEMKLASYKRPELVSRFSSDSDVPKKVRLLAAEASKVAESI